MCLECNQYPQEWLEKEAFDFFDTNQDILHNPGLAKIYQDWYNPYTEPEKLAKERKESGLSGQAWQRYVEGRYPGIDATEQKRLRIEERNEENKKRCGEIHYRKNPYNPAQTIGKPWYCKVKGCPTCDNRKKGRIKRQIKSVESNGEIYKVSEEQAKEIKASRTKEQYREYNNETTGESYIILDKDDKLDIAPEPFTDLLIEEIAEATVACETKRQSGKLSYNEPTEETFEKQVSIRQRVYTLELTEESTIADHNELDELVIAEFEKTGEAMHLDILQDAIYRLEQLTVKIAKEHCAKIHFLRTDDVLIYLSKVYWWDIIKDPFED